MARCWAFQTSTKQSVAFKAVSTARCVGSVVFRISALQPKQQSTGALRFRQSGCSVRAAAAVSAAEAPSSSAAATSKVRVRFAPSPTGNLHVGGARTALFNWLYAKNTGGQFVLRIEDTDAARSTKESEDAVLRDLTWLGLTWDEGPDCSGACGPYRQSERADIYMRYVHQLVDAGVAYPCFCSDEELDAMKKEAEEKKLPPIYRGKWASASAEEVKAAMDAGTPYCYRFRVPKNRDITIDDAIRGKVTWNTDTLGDFVLMRSNGLPVYNFCVAIDDALMGITNVIRAEEHLPNTLRQVLIYEALGFTPPKFGHVSLILAPDKSKLSKRHGATSVGEFREEGYLASAMVNYLALLGWNDGTEQEIFSVDELAQKFSLDRITKSGAVFDKTKLSWMNGQHLKLLPDADVVDMVASRLVQAGLLAKTGTPFVEKVIAIVKNSLELPSDAEEQVRRVLAYPLHETIASDEGKAFVEDGLADMAAAVLSSYDSGALMTAANEGPEAVKSWVKGLGKETKRKGKRLFMPIRICLSGSMAGPDVGELVHLLASENGDVADGAAYVPLAQRMQTLREWVASQQSSA